MFASIGVMFILPWLDTSRPLDALSSGLRVQFFVIFALVCLALRVVRRVRTGPGPVQGRAVLQRP